MENKEIVSAEETQNNSATEANVNADTNTDLSFLQSICQTMGCALDLHSQGERYSKEYIGKEVYMNYRSRFSLCMYYFLTEQGSKALTLIKEGLDYKIPLWVKTFKKVSKDTPFTADMLQEVLETADKEKVNKCYDELIKAHNRIENKPGKRTRAGGQ